MANQDHEQAVSGLLASEDDTHQLALNIGGAVQALQKPVVLALDGNLGAGKSFFARSLLRQFGVSGPVRSPTYTLIEPYDCDLGKVLHLDLYRLADPEEVLYLGLEEQLEDAALTMIEWPDKASGCFESFDATLQIKVTGDGREWSLLPSSDVGRLMVEHLAAV